MCIAGSVVADFWSDQQFRILFSNFSDWIIDPLPHQIVTTAASNAGTLVEYQLSHPEVFGLIPDDRNSNFGILYTRVRMTYEQSTKTSRTIASKKGLKKRSPHLLNTSPLTSQKTKKIQYQRHWVIMSFIILWNWMRSMSLKIKLPWYRMQSYSSPHRSAQYKNARARARGNH